MSIFVFQLFSKNDKDDNVVSGGKYDVVIRQTSTERDERRKRGGRKTIDNEWGRRRRSRKMLTCPSWFDLELINLFFFVLIA